MPTLSFAGGESWLFRVKNFRQTGNDRYIIELQPEESGKDFPLNCKVFTVNVHYDSMKWTLSTDKMISKEKHKESLSLVRQAQVSKQPIRFGSMGQGFGLQDGKSLCEVESKALSTLITEQGKEIYSFYKWP